LELEAMADWYWIENGVQNGPCDEVTLAAMLDECRIAPNTPIWRPGLSDWIPAQRALVAGPPNLHLIPPTPTSAFQSNSGSARAAYQPALALIADIRSVDFRSEVVPIDSNNVGQLSTDYVFWSATFVGIVPLLIGTLSDLEHQLTAFALLFAVMWGVLFKHFIIRKSNDWPICLAALFVSGVIGINLLLWITAHLLPKVYTGLIQSDHSTVKLIGFICHVGLWEEVTKSLPIIVYLAWFRRKADPYTALLVGVFSGLGFAAFENMGYGIASIKESYDLTRDFGAAGLVVGVQTAMVNVMLRSLSLVFCHAIWSGIVAYFLALGHVTDRRRIALYMVGIAVAAVLHGVYDWMIGIQVTFASLVVAGSFILFYAYVSKLRRLVESMGLGPERLEIVKMEVATNLKSDGSALTPT
jgi:RsiW-degrading membrane proteinase PrsW (M82 family)